MNSMVDEIMKWRRQTVRARTDYMASTNVMWTIEPSIWKAAGQLEWRKRLRQEKAEESNSERHFRITIDKAGDDGGLGKVLSHFVSIFTFYRKSNILKINIRLKDSTSLNLRTMISELHRVAIVQAQNNTRICIVRPKLVFLDFIEI